MTARLHCVFNLNKRTEQKGIVGPATGVNTFHMTVNPTMQCGFPTLLCSPFGARYCRVL